MNKLDARFENILVFLFQMLGVLDGDLLGLYLLTNLIIGEIKLQMLLYDFQVFSEQFVKLSLNPYG